MKAIIVIIVSALFVQSFAEEINSQFTNFLKTHRKNYRTNNELELRYSVWKKNLDFIEKFNQEADMGLHTYRLKMNAYGDFDYSEFTNLVKGNNETLRLRYPVQFDQITRSRDPATLPRSIDWRNYNYVTNVKDQGSCGSCWAFAATGVLEGQLAKKYGQMYSLSEQQLVDCTSDYDVYGCDGGFAELALAYVRDSSGLSPSKRYPYKAKQQSQCFTNIYRLSFTITGIQNIASGDELALQTAVGIVGPVALAIDASSKTFQFYSGGVYTNTACQSNMYSLDHAVLAVGYGTDPIYGDYWIVKNSWGTSWGENGYIRMARNKNNQCGVATDAVYATIA
jgi:cathepsin L